MVIAVRDPFSNMEGTKINSFIAWIGGKKYLRKEITKRFPDAEEYDCYIEVFGGAGWVLFHKDKQAATEIFNDFDGELVNLYRCVKYHCAELQRELDLSLISRELFLDHKEQLSIRGFTDIQRAARYYLLVRESFGADRRTFGVKKINLPKQIAYLSDISERLKNVIIENQDFARLLKVHDRPSALIYLDPPYYGTEKYYSGSFSKEDHIRLQKSLQQVKGKWILSYNDCEFIRDLYKDYLIEGITRNNNLVISKEEVQIYKEVIIRNYGELTG